MSAVGATCGRLWDDVASCRVGACSRPNARNLKCKNFTSAEGCMGCSVNWIASGGNTPSA